MPSGKIANLPREIRNELNHQISGAEIVAWLNAKPEVLVAMNAHFEGRPVLEQCTNAGAATAKPPCGSRAEPLRVPSSVSIGVRPGTGEAQTSPPIPTAPRPAQKRINQP